MPTNEEHIENAKAISRATSGVSNKDVVDFLGDPEKVAALRDHIADGGEDDDTGTVISIVYMTVTTGC